jgi:dTDP-4-dehydrorhamnose 3,5-epimerase
MRIRELSIKGSFEVSPDIHADQRGAFLEWFRADEFQEMTGHKFDLAQANCSVSARGTVRGIHFAELPPSQAKYVTCVHGSAMDVVVDIRIGSPTYGTWEAVKLDGTDRKAVYLSEGLGHAFLALEEDTVINYLCSTPYAPGREHAISPVDPTLDIDWDSLGGPGIALLLSPKDESAQTLAEARERRLLPEFASVTDFVSKLQAEL